MKFRPPGSFWMSCDYHNLLHIFGDFPSDSGVFSSKDQMMLYCVSPALSVSRLDFVIWFCVCFFLFCSLRTGLLSLNSLFPSIYYIDGCATTAAYLVSGWVFTLWPRARFLRSAYVRIQSINQSMCPGGSEFHIADQNKPRTCTAGFFISLHRKLKKSSYNLQF